MVKTHKSRILCVLLLVAMIATIIAPAGVFTASAAVTNPVADSSVWNTVADGWYVSADGGFKFNVGTWSYYGSYGITLVEDPVNFPTSCCTVAIYDNTTSSYDSPEVFENKTQEAFETVLSEDATVFEKRTIGNKGYTMYYCQTATYENYVFQTENAKYFINFIWATGTKEDFAVFAANVMDTIVLADDEPAFEGVKSVTHEVVNDKLVFTVVTTAGDYNRAKVAFADNAKGYIGYTSTYEVNADGDYVWTIAAKVPAESGDYVIDLRSSETRMYLQDYYAYEAEVEIIEKIKDVSYEVVNGKVVFTVTTGAGDYNRVKLAYADNAKGYVAYTSEYEVNADGDYVWTIKTAAPAESTDYVLDIRSSATRKYMKAYYDCEVEIIPNVKKISGVQVDDKVVFTVTTVAGDFDRIKVAYADNTKGYIAYAKTYTVNADGDYEWTLTVDMPAETTTYAFDLRNGTTKVYNRAYAYADVVVVEYPDPTVADNQDKVVNDVFTSKYGGLQMYAAGWKTYGLYSISMVPAEYNNQGQASAICVAVYDADSADVFANKTKEDFETTLQATIDTFEATTVCGYPAYKAVVTDMYYVWVVNTPTYKYFINFMQAAGSVDMSVAGAQMMDTVVIYK